MLEVYAVDIDRVLAGARACAVHDEGTRGALERVTAATEGREAPAPRPEDVMLLMCLAYAYETTCGALERAGRAP